MLSRLCLFETFVIVISFTRPNLSLSPHYADFVDKVKQSPLIDRSMALKTIQRLLFCKVSPTCKTFSVESKYLELMYLSIVIF